jgi:hypothetical protein
MKKVQFLFILLGLASLLLIYQTDRDHSRHVSRALSKIPKEDKETLEAFFFELYFSGGAYVLFGNKPMSICLFTELNYSGKTPLKNIIELSTCLHLQNIKANRGWKVWKKYEYLFPSSQFAIIENKGPDYITIAIVNKRNFLKIVEDNMDIFREFLGIDITSKVLLRRCLASSDLIREVFQGHDVLLGIVLGYGRHNARLFSRKTKIEEERGSPVVSSLNTQMVPANGFLSLEEEYQYINDLLSFFEERDLWECSCPILPLPGFVADPTHPETQQLKKQYREERKKIIEKYKKGDFLEITLEAFMYG